MLYFFQSIFLEYFLNSNHSYFHIQESMLYFPLIQQETMNVGSSCTIYKEVSDMMNEKTVNGPADTWTDSRKGSREEAGKYVF